MAALFCKARFVVPLRPPRVNASEVTAERRLSPVPPLVSVLPCKAALLERAKVPLVTVVVPVNVLILLRVTVPAVSVNVPLVRVSVILPVPLIAPLTVKEIVCPTW